MSNEFEDFFLKPTHVTHRKYEALRTLCVQKASAKEVARKFGYSIFSINAMKRDFISAIKNKQLDSSNYFITKSAGRTPDAGKSLLKENIIQLRKQHYLILDIKSVLHAEGHIVSHDYIYRVLEREGFARLAKRTQLERKVQASKIVKAPRSCSIDWMSDNGQLFHSERGAGILPFLPLLARLG